MAKDSAERHREDLALPAKHKRAPGRATAPGACLNRHISGVTRSSCSHRWQAKIRAATDDSTWYNDIIDGCDVSTSMSEPNFSDSSRVPYYHQAHHILPNAVLNTSIDDAAEQAGAKLYRLVRIGLLNAMYNLNFKDNMIILPMDRDVSKALKLPRHLHINQMKHAAYSKLVKSRVAPVIQDYASLIDDGEEHDEPAEEFDKEQLEAIPPPMRRAIRAWGVQQAPRTVTAMSRKFVLRVTGWR